MKTLIIISTILIAQLGIAGCEVKQSDQIGENNTGNQITEEKVLSAEEKEQKRVELVKRLESEGYKIWHEDKEPTQVYYKDNGDKRIIVNTIHKLQFEIPIQKEFKMSLSDITDNSGRLFDISIGTLVKDINSKDGIIMSGFVEWLSNSGSNADTIDYTGYQFKEGESLVLINNQEFLQRISKVHWYSTDEDILDSKEIIVSTQKNHNSYSFHCAALGSNWNDYIEKCNLIINSIRFM